MRQSRVYDPPFGDGLVALCDQHAKRRGNIGRALRDSEAECNDCYETARLANDGRRGAAPFRHQFGSRQEEERHLRRLRREVQS